MFSVACKKDGTGPNPNPGPGPDPNPGTQTKHLIKVEEDANTYTTFQYNADGTFQKITSVEDGENGPSQTVMTFTYNSAKKISEINNQDGSKIKYTYANNVVAKSEVVDAQNNVVAYNEYAYQNGKVSSVTLNSGIEDENGQVNYVAWMKTEYTYYTNGDVKENTVWTINPLTMSLEKTQVRKYEQYDTKVNPLSQLGEFSQAFLMDLSARNPLLEKAYDGAGSLQETVTYEYTYDNQGYVTAVKTTTTPVNGTAEVSNMKYFYN